MKTIDIHTHGIGGYDTRTTNVDHILKIAEIHGSQGISEIILTIYPATIKVMRENMSVIKKAMQIQKDSHKQSNHLHVEDHASRIIGVHLEGPFLNPSKCGALNAITFIEPTEDSLKELTEGFEDIIKIITIAPELAGASRLIKKITEMGIIASMGHSDATYAEAEIGFHSGAKGITHIFNAMRRFHHREPGLAGFGLMNSDIYIEIIADPHHLHPKTIEIIFNTKKHDKIILVSDTVRETTIFTKNQGITDAHGKLLGGCMTITESFRYLIDAGFDENVLISYITKNPERYLKLQFET